MATKTENEYPDPPSPGNEESDGEAEPVAAEEEANDSVARILKQLQSTGALIKKPKEEHRCVPCDESFRSWEDLENHLIQHVSLPSIILERLPSDDEDLPSGDDWSDEDEAPATAPPAAKTPQKLDISQIAKLGIQIKKPGDAANVSSTSSNALNKLSGLGFTIKKSNTPIKEEKSEDKTSPSKDLMQKLGSLGGIKLKLKSDGSNTNSFSVVNGLRNFKTSDDYDEGSGNEAPPSDEDKSPAPESDDEQNGGKSDDSGEEATIANIAQPKVEAQKVISKPAVAATPQNRRPAIKQTPKRGANLPIGAQIKPQPQAKQITTTQPLPAAANDTMENVVVKKEVETDAAPQNAPLFSGQIKTERSSPPPGEVPTSIPLISKVKSESDSAPATDTGQPPLSSTNEAPSLLLNALGAPLPPVTKTENEGVTIVEINGDSDDDDCCVVSATPAPDVKPVVPKTENTMSYTTPYQTTPSAAYSATSNAPMPPAYGAQEKQHSFNWNAPDSKPPIDMLEKSADDIFQSLLSSTKKEGLSLGDASEYISLDRLGSQHTCDVCNTRFTDVSLLDDHIRQTGHSKSIIMPSSSLMPYNPTSSALISNLLPVKQLAEQVGKLSTMGAPGSNAFTHQQNVMINIQAYPGGGGMMVPGPQYNAYPQGQNMPPGFPQGQSNMYGMAGQQMPPQYPGQQQQYMGQQPYGQQYQSKPSPTYGQSPYGNPPVSSPYSTASPLQSMQQSIYGQPVGNNGMMSSQQQPLNQIGQMGPPSMPSPSQQYAQASSPGGMKAPGQSGVRIQHVQTFSPGQLVGANGQPVAPGQVTSAQSPGQVRLASPGMTGIRPRMATTIRGSRPTIRPGIQVQGQVRGVKPGVQGPRMMKRPGQMTGGPIQKRRPDMLLPGKHDNEDCQVMAMQKQREGLPMIHSIQGAKDKLNLGSQISITKKTVKNEGSAMANMLAKRGISIKQKQKSRSPSPERPVPHIPNLPAGMSIKHTSRSSNFSIPEAKVGSGMYSCKICKKMFSNPSSLSIHMTNAHPSSKIPTFKCDECPASYPKILQLQHHKRTFHNVTGPNRELGLPVVDLSQSDTLDRLSNLGIYSYIPLAPRDNGNGSFGIPVISVSNMQNGFTTSLQALGADGLLSLGPLKSVPNT